MKLPRIPRWLSWVLVLAGLGFLVWRIAVMAPSLFSVRLYVWPVLPAALCFVGSVFFAVAGWQNLLGDIGFAKALRVFCLSQIARYVPGKVWAGVSRMGLLPGISSSRVVKSLLWEAGCLCFVAALFAVYRLPVTALYALVVLVAIAGLAMNQRRAGRVALAYFANWLLQGCAVCLLICTMQPVAFADLPWVMSAVTLSFLAGFVSFIPAGLGVRDVTLAVLLVPVMPESSAIVVAVLTRLVSSGVEIAMAGAARFVPGWLEWLDDRLTLAWNEYDPYPPPGWRDIPAQKELDTRGERTTI